MQGVGSLERVSLGVGGLDLDNVITRLGVLGEDGRIDAVASLGVSFLAAVVEVDQGEASVGEEDPGALGHLHPAGQQLGVLKLGGQQRGGAQRDIVAVQLAAEVDRALQVEFDGVLDVGVLIGIVELAQVGAVLSGAGLEVDDVGALSVVVGFIDEAALRRVLAGDPLVFDVHPRGSQLEVERPLVLGVQDDDDRTGCVGDEGDLARVAGRQLALPHLAEGHRGASSSRPATISRVSGLLLLVIAEDPPEAEALDEGK